jgi:hypothetical protein
MYLSFRCLRSIRDRLTRQQIFEMRPPFQGISEYQGINRIKRHGHTLDMPVGMSKCLWDLLQRCWNRDSNNRPGMEEVYGVLRSIGRF